MKKKKLIVHEEVNGQFIPKDDKKKLAEAKANQLLFTTMSSSPLFLSPTTALANASTTVDDVTGGIYSTLMTIFDTGVVFIIMFAGGAWALGHRSKAIHLLICVSCGYFLARNAVNIRDFMREI